MLRGRVLTGLIRDLWRGKKCYFFSDSPLYSRLSLTSFWHSLLFIYVEGFKRIIVFHAITHENQAVTIWSLVLRLFTVDPLLTPSGGDLRDGDPANEIPRVAAVRLLPGAGVGLQAPDGGHAGGEALCHRGGSGPRDWYMCQQHCTLPTTVQQDGGVSQTDAQQH